MLPREIVQADLFKKKFITPVSKVGLAREIFRDHGRLALAGPAGGRAEDGLAGAGSSAAFTALAGHKVWGKVARLAAAGSVGKYSGPCWPQADRLTALSARTRVLTRILGKSNMVKL